MESMDVMATEDETLGTKPVPTISISTSSIVLTLSISPNAAGNCWKWIPRRSKEIQGDPDPSRPAADEVDLHLLRTVGQQRALGRDDVEFASVVWP